MKTQEEIDEVYKKLYLSLDDSPHHHTWVRGYTQCQEDNVNKKYTEEDINKAINLARKTKVNVFGANGEESIGFVHSNNEVLKIVTNKQD